MRIVSLPEIQSVVAVPEAIEAVRAGFIAFSEGRIEQPDPIQLLFKNANGDLLGDCHGKAAQGEGLPYFVLKVATGFYNNVDKGLPVNNGMVLVMSAETGIPIAMLQDDGWLTQIRTAAAGALAAELAQVKKDATLGIVGTGTQALLQAQIITAHLGLSNVVVFGRSDEKAKALCNTFSQSGLHATPMASVRDVCHAADIVVTTTPSTTPVLNATDLPEKLHIIAVGTDSPGKLEIDPAVFASVDIIVTDNHQQCLHHGNFGSAVRAGVVPESADVSFCDLVAGQSTTADFSTANISLVDLTGLGVQDLVLAALVVDQVFA